MKRRIFLKLSAFVALATAPLFRALGAFTRRANGAIITIGRLGVFRYVLKHPIPDNDCAALHKAMDDALIEVSKTDKDPPTLDVDRHKKFSKRTWNPDNVKISISIPEVSNLDS